MGVQAYVFCLPLTIFERERRIRLDPELIAQQQGIAPVAEINNIGHMPGLMIFFLTHRTMTRFTAALC